MLSDTGWRCRVDIDWYFCFCGAGWAPDIMGNVGEASGRNTEENSWARMVHLERLEAKAP